MRLLRSMGRRQLFPVQLGHDTDLAGVWQEEMRFWHPAYNYFAAMFRRLLLASLIDTCMGIQRRRLLE
jgi:hypothetical protein